MRRFQTIEHRFDKEDRRTKEREMRRRIFLTIEKQIEEDRRSKKRRVSHDVDASKKSKIRQKMARMDTPVKMQQN